MSKWSFQLLPNTRDVLGKGFRVDSVTQDFEDQVNDALPYYFKFHKVSKLVISLGPKEGEKDYSECLGVAQKYYPDFDLNAYNKLNNEEKIERIKNVTIEVFDWLIDNFEDADCFKIGKDKMGWS